jgi:hypothetical protein
MRRFLTSAFVTVVVVVVVVLVVHTHGSFTAPKMQRVRESVECVLHHAFSGPICHTMTGPKGCIPVPRTLQRCCLWGDSRPTNLGLSLSTHGWTVGLEPRRAFERRETAVQHEADALPWGACAHRIVFGHRATVADDRGLPWWDHRVCRHCWGLGGMS